MSENKTTESPIVVTGANGFIASHIIEQLLSNGYKVKGTTRTLEESKIEHLKKFKNSENLQLLKANLTEENSFDEVIKDSEFVMHVASPFTFSFKDAKKEILNPAINGTLSILNSCLKSKSVKRVVLTSSTYAMVDIVDKKKTYTENDWNETSSLTDNPYAYSKTMAEKEAWKFMDEKKPHFDLIVINPSMVLGPGHKSSLSQSQEIILDILNGKHPVLIDLIFNIVDVRDVAKSHIIAIRNENLKGRYLCMNKSTHIKDVCGCISKNFNDVSVPTTDMSGTFGSWTMYMMSYTLGSMGSELRKNLGITTKMNNKKIKNDMNIEFIDVEKTLVDTVQYLKDFDFISKK
eukprot:gene6606-10769_t